MNPTSSPSNVQANHNTNSVSPSPSANPNQTSSSQPNHNTNTASSASPNQTSISVDTDIAHVDRLELEAYARRDKQIADALEARRQEAIQQGRQGLTEKEEADVKRTVEATEAAERVPPRTLTITVAGQPQEEKLSTLPHSYRLIRNLLWIQQHPVYRTALAEWESEVNLFASRIGRKLERRGALKNDVYSMIGFYSVFQGVLLTATSQSSYLRCQNVGLPIALSAFASIGTLLHIGRKFKVISDIQRTISSEEIPLKEAKARIQALKEKGEAFRFYDFLENKPSTWSNFRPKLYLCAFRAQDLVLVAIVLFSLAFITAHPLILCRPGAQ